MAEGRTPQPSFIPVMSSTPAAKRTQRGPLPNALSLPQLSLKSNGRNSKKQIPVASPTSSSTTSLSVAQSPAYPNTPSNSSPASSTGIPKFRSLRNMLPFGPKSSPISSPEHRGSLSPPPSFNPNGPKGTFFNTLMTRHSFSVERKSSVASAPAGSSQYKFSLETSPVISIQPPFVGISALDEQPEAANADSLGDKKHFLANAFCVSADSFGRLTPNPTQGHRILPDSPSGPGQSPVATLSTLSRTSSSPSASPRIGETKEIPQLDVELNVSGAGDLSTILESDLSGMSVSKYLPPAEDGSPELSGRILEGLEGLQSPQPRAFFTREPTPNSEALDNEASRDGMALSHLARKVHRTSLSYLRQQSLDVSNVNSPSSDVVRSSRDRPWADGVEEFKQSIGRMKDGFGHDAFDPDRLRKSLERARSPEDIGQTRDRVVPLAMPKPINGSLLLPSSPQVNIDKLANPNVTFDMSSLDPDLAALLSPNNLSVSRASRPKSPPPAEADASTRPMSLSPSPSPAPQFSKAGPSGQDKKRGLLDFRPRANLSTSNISTSSQQRQTSPQPQSLGKGRPSAFPASFSKDGSGKEKRRVSLDIQRTPPNLLGSGDGDQEKVASTSTAGIYLRPQLVRSQSALASSTGSLPPRPPPRKRAPTPRLQTLARSGSANASSSSPSQGLQALEEMRTMNDRSNVSQPPSRASSALGMASTSRRQQPLLGRSSIDHRPDDFASRQESTNRLRRRKRSLSFNEVARSADSSPNTYQRKPIAEWLGPRTAKAFAAAGLLDHEKEVELHAPGRLRSLTRTSIDRDSNYGRATPSLHAPSRTGFSDASPSSTHRGRSGSQAMSSAELASLRAGGSSPLTITSSTATTASHARTPTVYSTATSVSGGNSPHTSTSQNQAQFDSTIQSLKEKHAIEMEALLNALADSQRASKSLREENASLKGRITDLEEQLQDVVEKLKTHLASSQSPSPVLPQSRLPRSVGIRKPRPPHIFSIPHENTEPDSDEPETPVPDELNSESEIFHDALAVPEEDIDDPSVRHVRHRFSTASSIFPTLPNNMPLLMQEADGDGYDMQDMSGLYSQAESDIPSPSLPPSPTLVLSRLVQATPRKARHRAKLSVSSIGTEDISMLSASPGSLYLKPEHERHLGDMLDLSADHLDL